MNQLVASQSMLYLSNFIGDLLSYRFSTSETLVAVCLTSLLGMYLLMRTGKYSPFTRSLMDVLAAVSFSSGLIVILMAVFA